MGTIYRTGGCMNNESIREKNLEFPDNQGTALISKTIKVIHLINKQVQITCNLN